jgi:hypothetical protein
MALGGGLVGDAAIATQPMQVRQSRFEGHIGVRMTRDRQQAQRDMQMEVKDDRARFDLPPSSNAQHQSVHAIIDMRQSRVVLVMPAQRTYAVLDLNQIPAESKATAEKRIRSEAGNWTATATGTTKTLAGHTCNEWQARNSANGDKIDACLAPDVRIDFDAMLPGSLLPAAWTDKLKNGELPLSATGYDSKGKVTFQEQVSSVRPQAVPDSDFEPDPSYKRVDVPLSAFVALLPRNQ